MTHLTPEQFVDALEERNDRRTADHLERCEICRRELAALTATWRDAESVPRTEPSPLFWDHFSRRVREATDLQAMPVASPFGRFVQGAWRPLATMAVAVGALALVVLLRPPSRSAEPGAVATTASVTTLESVDRVVDEGMLNVVAAAATDLKVEEIHQMVRPTADATSAAIEDLTPEQRVELIRLIKLQMKGSVE
jgi:hypothetical protein